MALVSVIMSVFNGEQYLKECIESILSQTLTDFEFVITDDCSTDESLKIILEFQKNDSRIKLIKNEKNIGLTKSLNNMLDVVSSKYIARMDADDVSLPTRLEKQVKHMDKHPETGVCSVFGREKGGKYPKDKIELTHEQIKTTLLFYNVIPHSHSMFRGEIIFNNNLRYNEDFTIIQDYELWSRLINVTKFHILSDIFYEFRHVKNSVTATSAKKANYREGFLKKIYEKNIKNLNIDYNNNDLDIHYFISSNKLNDDIYLIEDVERWLIEISNKNNMTNYYSNEFLNLIIFELWYSVCTRSSSLGIKVFFKYYTSKLYRFGNLGRESLLKIFIKCLFSYKANPQGRYS